MPTYKTKEGRKEIFYKFQHFELWQNDITRQALWFIQVGPLGKAVCNHSVLDPEGRNFFIL